MNKRQKKVLYRIAAVVLWLAAMRFFAPEGWLGTVGYLIPYLVIGYDILWKAAHGIWRREVFDENFLMAVATVGALLLGEYVEGVAVMLFYQTGELFQSVAVGKSRRSISELMDIRPDYANLEREDGSLEQVDPEEVEPGSVVVVKPGERIPIDGTVEQGTSTLNTSALTGESLPRDVGAGEAVISGCININGLLKIRTTKEFGESTVSKILDLVENSSMKKSKPENFITKFAHYYTPAVCYGALALALLPPVVRLILGEPALWSAWINRALVFLVISCPCALVISVPLSFFGGIGGSASCGILVKGSNYLEALARMKYVVFDKTGTLTKGVFEVTDICPSKEWQERQGGQQEPERQEKQPEPQEAQGGRREEQRERQAAGNRESLLKYAACAESYSTHPISMSLKAAYAKELEPARNVEEISGHGVTATVGGHKVAAGNARLMKRLGLTFPETDRAGTVVHVSIDGEYSGYILIADVPKETSREAVGLLKKEGVKKVIMLTGDRAQAAEAIGAALNVDEVKSELLPADKVEEVERLLGTAERGRKDVLAFVGDGINDAPVLSRADIGIAMGALGSDAAIEAADVVLMDDNPLKIVLAMRISRKCIRIVYENIVFALAVKAVCLILGALDIANMWTAIFADVGVMVLAVLNAVRCLWNGAGKRKGAVSSAKTPR
ncbi:MAG: HAD-IC family P-type ATPase [Clostridium sp.]|jgi:Cd2+/Zn2+-exporting ATPase|nr:HAD-IC family P-type ATPase [Clostridium sp.]